MKKNNQSSQLKCYSSAQGHGERRSRRLGEDCVFRLKQKWIKIGVLARRPFRYGRSALQQG